jgi:hypothetical protein
MYSPRRPGAQHLCTLVPGYEAASLSNETPAFRDNVKNSRNAFLGIQTLCRNVGIRLPTDSASYPRRTVSSAIPLWTPSKLLLKLNVIFLSHTQPVGMFLVPFSCPTVPQNNVASSGTYTFPRCEFLSGWHTHSTNMTVTLDSKTAKSVSLTHQTQNRTFKKNSAIRNIGCCL